MTLQKFPDYWRKPLPYLAELDYQVIPDASAKLAALLNKQVDFIDSVPLALVAQVAEPERHHAGPLQVKLGERAWVQLSRQAVQ